MTWRAWLAIGLRALAVWVNPPPPPEPYTRRKRPMAEKVERKTTAEVGVAQDLLDAHYDAVDLANEEGRDNIGRPIKPKAQAPVEDKAVKGPKSKE